MDQLRAEDPKFIGPYRLIGRLGAGGMGVVYRAEAPDGRYDGRPLAVKLVRAEAAADEEFRRRFAREVGAARLVGDEWTARVLDADTEAEVPWVATEYVPGPSLRAAVEGSLGPLPAASVLVLAHRLGLALRAIHGAGLIHRDLKPSNILLTVGGPRVIDFGIARRSVLSSESDLTRTGVLLGSPEFMSPEQVRGEEVRAASDVFALGAVLAYASTGRAPFSTGDPGVHGLLFRVAYEEPDVAGVPETVAELIHDCLSKDPSGRPTVDTVISRTRKALGGAWLPPDLLARLDEDAADFLRAVPRKRSQGPVRMPRPDLRAAAPDSRPRPPQRAAEPASGPASGSAAGSAPDAADVVPRKAHVRRTRGVRAHAGRAGHARRGVLAVPGARHGMSALLAAACVVAYAVFATAPSFVQGPSDGTTESDHFAGVWLGNPSPDDEESPWAGPVPGTLRLDIVDSTRIGGPSGTFLAASSEVFCQGEFSVAGRTRLSLGIAAFKVTSSSPAGTTAADCWLPDSLRLTKNEGVEYAVAETDGHQLFRMQRRAAPAETVPRQFSNVWGSGDGLVVDIRPGKLGEPVVRTIETADGRHCEYTAALLHVGRNTILTATPVPDQDISDPDCWMDSDNWEYSVEAGRPPTLLRTGDLGTRRLRPVK
ncbi:protein kinase [Streptomyces sp. NPDC002825]|uniref:protein kinase domain-containing protein n=1 Tax=Streptomyces sp. NPDC002825 TaxID=3154666 RepID=UPI0033168D0E